VTGRAILAEDDQGGQLAIGPVYTTRSLKELRRAVAEHGWAVVAVIPFCSRADLVCARAGGRGVVTEADW
jgi:hypothetical protein